MLRKVFIMKHTQCKLNCINFHFLLCDQNLHTLFSFLCSCVFLNSNIAITDDLPSTWFPAHWPFSPVTSGLVARRLINLLWMLYRGIQFCWSRWLGRGPWIQHVTWETNFDSVAVAFDPRVVRSNINFPFRKVRCRVRWGWGRLEQVGQHICWVKVATGTKRWQSREGRHTSWQIWHAGKTCWKETGDGVLLLLWRSLLEL